MSWNVSAWTLAVSAATVSLLVRLWVEILLVQAQISKPFQSASSWGCELKWESVLPPVFQYRQPPREAVSWNLEVREEELLFYRQPPREAVSWNSTNVPVSYDMIKSASSWGCELKWWICKQPVTPTGQPPREAVSWNARGSESPFEVRLLVRLPIQQDITRILPPL